MVFQRPPLEVLVYEEEEPKEPVVIFDHLSNPFVRKRIKLGFDLDV